MSNPFVLLYKLFESRKALFYSLLLLLSLLIVYFSSKLVLKEDISAFIPKDQKTRKYQEAIKNLKANDRLIVNVYLKDSATIDPDALTQYADILAERLSQRFGPDWIKEIRYKIDDETASDVFNLLFEELPYYLEKEDYRKIESQLSDSSLYNKVKSNYETIVSPEGTVLKSYILQDPLGLNYYALAKLARLQSDDNFNLYNGYFLSKDKKNLFLYLTTGYSSNESEKNEILIKGLYEEISKLDSAEYKNIRAEYFGSPAVAVSNVFQIKKDSILTTIVALVLIFAGLLLYFKKIKTLFLIFLPVVFGGGFSLAIVYLLRGEISAIAIGAGSIVLGIAINYSLHFFTHLKHETSIVKVISDLTIPLTLGCVTTIGAFLCLHFMQSEALQDMGLFAAMSLLGAAFCCLIILPPMVKSLATDDKEEHKADFLDKFTTYPFHKSKTLLILIALLTLLFSFTYNRVGFETDMTKLSYISPELENAENNLDKITQYKLKSVFLVSQGKDLEEALKINATAKKSIQELVKQNVVKKYSDIGEFLLTDSAKVERLKVWNSFWNKDRINNLELHLYKYGNEFHFKESAFNPTLSLLKKEFNPKNDSCENILKNLFLNEYINVSEKGTSVITILKVDQVNKEAVYSAFDRYNDLFVVDRGSMAMMFAKVLNQDFNLILVLSSLLVFGFLFLSYGRIELAVLAFLPMLISWIWILGIMGIFGIKFNIVNIIICTFMFGLGDDFSIFTLDGLEQEYKYGKNVLASYRNSIVLSAFTVIVGIGVLIFAKHPALQSIALVTIIGIFCIVFISMVVQPFVYEKLVLGRVKRKQLPITLHSIILSSLLFLYFIKGGLISRIIYWLAPKASLRLRIQFISSLNRFILFNERKCGEDLFASFIQKHISLIPKATEEMFKSNYSELRNTISDTDFYRGRLIKNYVFKGPVVEWYTRIKVGLEDNYKVFNELVPKKGKIVDVGCGYGYLTYMLSLTSSERTLIGIDYDEEKIKVAQNGVSKTPQLNFFSSDVLDYKYSDSDAFIISDVLHYLTEENQAVLIKKCIENLNPNGILIIRDGNSELENRHKGTKLTEYFSTKLIGFNKVTIDKLCFTSKEKIVSIVSDYPVSIEMLDNTQFTSNIIFVIRKDK